MQWRRPPSKKRDEDPSKQQENVTWGCKRRSCHMAILRCGEDPGLEELRRPQFGEATKTPGLEELRRP